MFVLKTRANICAKAEDVYRVLTDFEGYSQWNPFISCVSGKVGEGERITVKPKRLSLVGSLHYEIDELSEPDRLHWTEVDWYGFVAYSTRERHLYPRSDGTVLYTSKFYIKGPLSGFFGLLLRQKLYVGLQDETHALKDHCEKHYYLEPAARKAPMAVKSFEATA